MSTLRENTSEQSKGDSLSRSLSHGQLTMIAMGLALGTGLFLGVKNYFQWLQCLS